MQNIETKARVPNLQRVRELALDIGAREHGISHDTDTYFRPSQGRLKLRVTNGRREGTLIAYHRPDEAKSRVSDYQLVAIDDADSLREALATTLGVLATVSKSRRLLWYGATRIHLDEVEQLGSFVELETVLTDQPRELAELEHRFLRQALELDDAEIVPVSYSDLIIEQID